MSGRRTGPRRGQGGRDDTTPAPDDPSSLRTVALVGPPAAGKTTLIEELLAATGAIPRAGSVTAGTTVCDHDPESRRQQRSVSLAVASARHRDVKINFVDTPGCADFVGDVRAGLRAADAAVFVLGAADAVDGLDAPTRALWAECASAGLPRLLVLSRLDHQRADPGAALAACRAELDTGGAVLASVAGETGAALLDLSIEELSAEEVEPACAELIETLIEQSEDESLLDRWISGDPVALAALRADLAAAVGRGALIPVVGVTAPEGVGLDALLDLLVDAVPPPTAHAALAAHGPNGAGNLSVAVDPDGPLVAEVVHTEADAQAGRVSLVRVFSGRLRPDSTVTVAHDPRRTDGIENGGDGTVRIARVYAPLGAVRREMPAAVAGDLCALTRLSTVSTGDTLCGAEDPIGLDGWVWPEPLLPVAVGAADRAAQDAMARGLARLTSLETTLRVERNEETHQVVLWCTGEAHAELVLARLRAGGAEVEVTEVTVPVRETIARAASGRGRHVKQSGGHGQFAVCSIEMEPLPRGAGVEFIDRIVGGAIPRAYIPGVEKGVRAQLESGVTPGRPVVDVRVTLVDGKAHSVDSSEQAFQTAGALAVREAVEAAGTVELQPVHDVEIFVDDDHLGAVLGDLASRHGRVVGTEPGPERHTAVHAEVPENGLLRYAIDLRALCGGSAHFTRRFSRYEPVAGA